MNDVPSYCTVYRNWSMIDLVSSYLWQYYTLNLEYLQNDGRKLVFTSHGDYQEKSRTRYPDGFLLQDCNGIPNYFIVTKAIYQPFRQLQANLCKFLPMRRRFDWCKDLATYAIATSDWSQSLGRPQYIRDDRFSQQCANIYNVHQIYQVHSGNLYQCIVMP